MFGFSLLISKTSAICGNKSPFKGTESECKGEGIKALLKLFNYYMDKGFLSAKSSLSLSEPMLE